MLRTTVGNNLGLLQSYAVFKFKFTANFALEHITDSAGYNLFITIHNIWAMDLQRQFPLDLPLMRMKLSAKPFPE